MAEELTPEICVIGGGPGGIALAEAAAEAEVSVVLIEKATLGGANLLSGTVPTRALVAAADTYEALRAGPAMGVSGAPLQVNLGKVRDHIAAVTEAAAAAVTAERLTALGVRVIAATGRFTDERTVVAGDIVIRARHTVLAVGALPAIPDLPGLADVEVMTAASGFDLSRKPAHLLMLGAGAHALALAQAYCRLGIDTSIIDAGATLPDEDPELSAIVVERLKADGVGMRTGATISSIARRRGGVRITVVDATDGEVAVDGSHVMAVGGRTPDVADLSLSAAGIDHGPTGIVVDERLRTSNHNVYAIGDAVDGPALAGRAAEEGRRLFHALIHGRRFSREAKGVPAVSATDPQIASVGFSEADARRHYRQIRVLRFPFSEIDLAQAERAPAGVIKVVTTMAGEILGVAIVGRDAGELIAPWSLAIANRLPVTALADFPVPYPSRSAIAARVAATFPGPGLTRAWSQRIIALFRQPGRSR